MNSLTRWRFVVRPALCLTACIALGAAATEAQSPAPSGKPGPLAHTFSIVARDPATGEMGVAVQSHWFSVGPIVPWA